MEDWREAGRFGKVRVRGELARCSSSSNEPGDASVRRCSRVGRRAFNGVLLLEEFKDDVNWEERRLGLGREEVKGDWVAAKVCRRASTLAVSILTRSDMDFRSAATQHASQLRGEPYLRPYSGPFAPSRLWECFASLAVA